MGKVKLPTLEEYKNDLWLCGRCGDCSIADKIVASNRGVYHPCAVKNVLGFEVFSPRGRIMVMNDLLNGKLEVTNDIVDWAFSCTTCKNCQETCIATADGIRLPEMIEALRKDLVQNGFDMLKHRVIEDSIINEGNPYKESRSQRLALFRKREWPEKASTVFFVGCTSSYREKEIAIDTVKLLDEFGADYTILPDEKCCGSVLLRLGRKKAFENLTTHNIKAIMETGANTIVTSCAGCYRTWKIDVLNEGYEYDFKILHITEYLDKLVQEGSVSFEAPELIKVTYHDPCHLGRHAEVYEAPRRVITSVENVELVEMETNKRYAHCCGSGGGCKGSFEDLADRVAADRIREAELTGVDILVTSCPFCHKGLVDGAMYINSSMKILDLPAFLLPYIQIEHVRTTSQENPLKVQFMDYLRQHPLIFDGLKRDAIIDYEIEGERFYVHVLGKGNIEVNPFRAENPDVELTFSNEAVRVLTSIDSEDEYAVQFGSFFKEPTENKWIKFNLRRNIVKLLMKGYRKFAQKAGLI